MSDNHCFLCGHDHPPPGPKEHPRSRCVEYNPDLIWELHKTSPAWIAILGTAYEQKERWRKKRKALAKERAYRRMEGFDVR